MPVDARDDLLGTCGTYLAWQHRLLNRLSAGADPAAVATAMQAQLELLATAVAHCQRRPASPLQADPGE